LEEFEEEAVGLELVLLEVVGTELRCLWGGCAFDPALTLE